jgi:anti-sigma factor RsiW
MTCAESRALVGAYADRELDLVRSLEIEAHLHSCGGCARDLQQLQELRSAITTAPLTFTPSAALRRRVGGALRREAGPRALPTLRVLQPFALPAAAVLVLALSWSLVANRGGRSAHELLLNELVAGHVRALQVDHLVDVASSDQHTVKPWFNGKVDFAPRVADFTVDGFPLVGGRVDYVAGRPAAVLVYKHRQHVINVFIRPAEHDAASAIQTFAAAGYHLLRWDAAGLTYWAVSDLNPADLESLARLLQQTS